MRAVVSVLLTLSLFLSVAFPLVNTQEVKAEVSATGSEEKVFLPFQAKKFLQVSSGDERVRVEDLKFVPPESTFLGETGAKASVSIKNLTERKLQVSVYVALFDENKKLLAAGNYSTVPMFGGLEPREALSKDIDLGRIKSFGKVKFYQYRVVVTEQE